MDRKVLLIDPGQKFAENGSRHSVRQTPHIGLCYLATTLREFADVKVLDMPLLRLGDDDLLEEYKKLDSGDIVGITTATFNVVEAVRAAEMAKSHNPELLVVMGGPHVNAFPTDVLERTEHVDAAVSGEGEVVFSEIVRNYDQPDFTWDIPGVAWRDGETIAYWPLTKEWTIQDLDDIPLPDWDFLDLNKYSMRYSSQFDSMEQVAPLSTNRGCPYQCSFCDGANLTGKLKFRSAQNVIDEIQNGLEKHGVRHYYITDSVMCIPKWRFLEFCDLMVSTGLNKEVSMIGQAQINSIDEEILVKYRKAGGEYIFFGLESGNEEVLKQNGKRISKDKVRAIVDCAHESGLHPRGSFIFGLPYDTRSSVEETIEFSHELKLHSANFFILDFYPGTRAKDYLLKGEGGLTMLDGGIDWSVYTPSRDRAEVQVNDLTPDLLRDYLAQAKAMPMKYEDQDLTFRQKVTEFIYFVENGFMDISESGEWYNAIEEMKPLVPAATLAACAPRLERISELTSSYARAAV